MLAWDPKQVSQFLGTEPVVKETQFSGPEFTYEFPVGDLLAYLVVWPRERDVLLRLVPRGATDEIVQWRLGCDRILFNDQDPEEGGQCLVVAAWMPDDIATRPTHPNHWLIIARRADGFHIGSYFARESKSIRVR